MGERPKISVLLTTGNEERNVRDCLESVKWADEILVVDSFSTDRTVEIAREYTPRILQRAYRNAADQKNWALPQLEHPWVLVIDADERVTPELREEILAAVSSPGALDGYRVRRLNHFMGRPVRYSGWQRDWVTRLFRNGKGRFPDREVHADTVVEGRVGRLRGRLLHYTFGDWDAYLAKFVKYTGRAARDRAAKTPKARWWHLTLRPAWRFVKQYFIHLGFLDGRTGLVICTLSAVSVFLKYARLEDERPQG